VGGLDGKAGSSVRFGPSRVLAMKCGPDWPAPQIEIGFVYVALTAPLHGPLI